MEKSFLRKYPIYFLLLLLLLPHLWVTVTVANISLPNAMDWIFLLKNALPQSLLSAALSVLVGLFLAWGIQWAYAHSKKLGIITEWLCLLPGLLPSLFVILSLQNLAPTPLRGIFALIGIHTFLQMGLCAVILNRAIKQNVGTLIDLAQVEGASFFAFWSATLRELFPEIIGVFIASFIFSLTSFSAPLLLAAPSGSTIEMLIYEKIRIHNDLSQALFLGWLQVFILFFIFYKKKTTYNTQFTPKIWAGTSKFTQSKTAFGLIVLFAALSVTGFFMRLPTGVSQLLQMQNLKENFISSVLNTTWIACLAGTLTMIYLLFTGFWWDKNFLHRFIFSYAPPSLAITSLVLNQKFQNLQILWVSIFLSIFYFAILYRWQWHALLSRLQGQFESAKVLGANRQDIFIYILLPQAWSSACHLGGILAFWVAGEFAFTQIFLGKPITVASWIQGLMHAYRFEAANVLAVILLFLSSSIYFLFWSLSYVVDSKD